LLYFVRLRRLGVLAVLAYRDEVVRGMLCAFSCAASQDWGLLFGGKDFR
jgi:hypothetical protein